MIKLFLIFLVGILETFINVAYLLAVNKKNIPLATFLEFVYSIVYLFIVAYALLQAQTVILLVSYASGCSIGTCLQMLRDKYSEKRQEKINTHHWTNQ